MYLEHNAPTEHAVRSEHPVLHDPRLDDVLVAHVTAFNAMAWDCGGRPTTVVEHGIPDPGLRYTGSDASLAVVVNEPVRRWRIAGSDVVLDLARCLPVSVYGLSSDALGAMAEERALPGLDRAAATTCPSTRCTTPWRGTASTCTRTGGPASGCPSSRR